MATCSVIEKLEWLQTYRTAFMLQFLFYNAIIGLSYNCFSLGMPEYVTYKYRAENGICYVM